MRRSFDHLARPYQLLEQICFGNSLQRARVQGLPNLKAAKKALLIGDGDGRFSQALLETNAQVEIDSLDISRRMLERSSRRCASHQERLHLIQENALAHLYEHSAYDAVGLHFIMDCFCNEQAQFLAERVHASMKEGAFLLYSDFSVASPLHRIIVKCLYMAFSASAGVTAKQLPKFNWPNGIRTIERKEFRGGLFFSEVLRKEA